MSSTCTCTVARTLKLKEALIIKPQHKLFSVCERIAFAVTRFENTHLSFCHTLGNNTYHDIIAFNQKLSVKGPRNFKCLCDFSGGSLNLRAMKTENTHIYATRLFLSVSYNSISVYT